MADLAQCLVAGSWSLRSNVDNRIEVFMSAVQGPLSRFGDTAANAGMLSLLEVRPMLQKHTVVILFASAWPSCVMMLLLPSVPQLHRDPSLPCASALPFLLFGVWAGGGRYPGVAFKAMLAT